MNILKKKWLTLWHILTFLRFLVWPLSFCQSYKISNSLQNLQFVIFCMHAFIVVFFLLIRRIRSQTCLVKFLLSKSFKHVLTLSLEQHVSSCILFVTLVLDRSVIVDILWYLLWYPLISINIRVDIHCYPHWFLYYALSLSQLIVGPLSDVQRVNRSYPIWT